MARLEQNAKFGPIFRVYEMAPELEFYHPKDKFAPNFRERALKMVCDGNIPHPEEPIAFEDNDIAEEVYVQSRKYERGDLQTQELVSNLCLRQFLNITTCVLGCSNGKESYSANTGDCA